MWVIDSNVAVTETGSLQSFLNESAYVEPQFDLIATSAFAAIGLVLVVVGVFSVRAYSVSLRAQEIGIRMALGASRVDIVNMILKKGIILIGTGVMLGTFVSLWLTRFIAAEISGIAVTDPWTFAAVAFLVLVAGIAGYILPAHTAQPEISSQPFGFEL